MPARALSWQAYAQTAAPQVAVLVDGPASRTVHLTTTTMANTQQEPVKQGY